MTDATHQVRNRITGKIKHYKSLKAALRAADKADNEYGAYICTVSRIPQGWASAG